jgi:hypothetical protein
MARKEHKYHFIYKIVNIKSGRYYIGMHSTHNLDEGYMGGGKRITNSVRRHGKEAHTKEILEYFNDRESLRQREIELVNEELLNDPMCMNLQPGGGGGFINEDHMKKCILASVIANREIVTEFWKDPENRKKRCNEIREAFKKLSIEQKKSYASHGFKDKKHTEGSKESIGEKNSISQKRECNSQWGTFWVNHPEIGNKKIKGEENLNEYINSGWNRGRNMKFNKS